MMNPPLNRANITETNKLLKVKCTLNQFNFIDHDSCWSQPNACLKSDMFYLDKRESSIS